MIYTLNVKKLPEHTGKYLFEIKRKPIQFFTHLRSPMCGSAVQTFLHWIFLRYRLLIIWLIYLFLPKNLLLAFSYELPVGKPSQDLFTLYFSLGSHFRFLVFMEWGPAKRMNIFTINRAFAGPLNSNLVSSYLKTTKNRTKKSFKL